MRTAAAGEKDLGVRAQREGSRIVEGGGWTDNSPRRSTHGAYVIQTESTQSHQLQKDLIIQLYS